MEDPTPARGTPPRFFEGTEKKVELVVAESAPSLRGSGDEYWNRIAASCGARILSKISNDRCDAYLLSESSLFVFDHKMIMITCGRTRLPDAVLELLRSVPRERIEFFVYERKNEVYPHRQPSSFYDDVRVLNEALPGKAFRLGDEDEHHILLFHLDRPYRSRERDLTVELLMYGIDDGARTHFDATRVDASSSVRERTGIDRVLPGFLVDDYLFQPGGYSFNAIRDDMYWTVHVTPEKSGSYVSFETNYRFGDDLDRVAGRLLELFRPRSFDLVVFHQDERIDLEPERYRLRSHVAQQLSCGYEICFKNYFRPPGEVRRAIELPVD